MLSIWPSLSAAPRMRHSALASRSALSSVSQELVEWAPPLLQPWKRGKPGQLT
jgi:hypothetical protein